LVLAAKAKEARPLLKIVTCTEEVREMRGELWMEGLGVGEARKMGMMMRSAVC